MANSLKVMIIILIGLSSYATLSHALTTERVMVDPQNGLALAGFDAVSFHLDPAPRKGKADIEELHEGAIWVFATPTNRSAFKENPAYYTPAYGGYDITGIAEGRVTPGNPKFWTKHNGKVFLFFSEKRHNQFVANPDLIRRKAAEVWPELKSGLRY